MKYDPVEAEHTDALNIEIDGTPFFIGRKGSAYREGRLKELASLLDFQNLESGFDGVPTGIEKQFTNQGNV